MWYNKTMKNEIAYFFDEEHLKITLRDAYMSGYIDGKMDGLAKYDNKNVYNLCKYSTDEIILNIRDESEKYE